MQPIDVRNQAQDSSDFGHSDLRDNAKLETLLAHTRASDLAIVADMTGTLIVQSEDGFPIVQRQNLTRLLDAGAVLILATADPLKAVGHHFVDRLNYRGKGACFIISTAGYLGHSLEGGELKHLFTGAQIPADERQILLEAVGHALSQKLQIAEPFPAPVKERLLLGTRQPIQDLAPDKLGPKAAVDVYPGKISIFFLDHLESTCLEQGIMQHIASNPAVQRVLKSCNLQMFQGANYLDILSCPKEMGLAHLFASSELAHLELNKRVHLAMGDSANDRGLLTYPFHSSRPSLRVFLGKDQKLVDDMRRDVLLKTGEHVYFLKGEYTHGSQRLLTCLSHGIASRPQE